LASVGAGSGGHVPKSEGMPDGFRGGNCGRKGGLRAVWGTGKGRRKKKTRVALDQRGRVPRKKPFITKEKANNLGELLRKRGGTERSLIGKAKAVE